MNLIDRVHSDYIFGRRVGVLTRHLAELMPKDAKTLDVGCGDGTIAHLLMQSRPDLTISGIDVLVRPQTHIPVVQFDGRHIPYEDDSFDAVMFVDVLHHTEDPLVLLREAARVARSAIVIKDHTMNGWLAEPTLRLMDYVGNAQHGVVLPYNYWPLSDGTRHSPGSGSNLRSGNRNCHFILLRRAGSSTAHSISLHGSI